MLDVKATEIVSLKVFLHLVNIFIDCVPALSGEKNSIFAIIDLAARDL